MARSQVSSDRQCTLSRPLFQNGTFTAANQAVWGVTGTDDYILYAGEFTRVNNVGQQGIVRFARRDAAPNKQGPVLGGADATPTVSSVLTPDFV